MPTFTAFSPNVKQRITPAPIRKFDSIGCVLRKHGNKTAVVLTIASSLVGYAVYQRLQMNNEQQNMMRAAKHS